MFLDYVYVHSFLQDSTLTWNYVNKYKKQRSLEFLCYRQANGSNLKAKNKTQKSEKRARNKKLQDDISSSIYV